MTKHDRLIINLIKRNISDAVDEIEGVPLPSKYRNIIEVITEKIRAQNDWVVEIQNGSSEIVRKSAIHPSGKLHDRE